MRLSWLLCMGMVVWSADLVAAGPSFDCKKASTVDELVICRGGPYLANIDRELADAVRKARIPISEQKRWVSERNQLCGLSRHTEEAALDFNAAAECLYKAYEARLVQVQIPSQQHIPSRFPFLPRLTENHDPKLCQAFEAAQQASFKSMKPAVSALDRPWPGGNVQWIASPETLSDKDTSDLRMVYPADLDGDGTSEILLLTGKNHSWRGDIFSLVRFASQTELDKFEQRTNKDSPSGGTSVLVRASGFDDPFPWDWHIPGLMTVNGRYYLLDEGAVWEDTAPAILYRIPAEGKPEQICTVERIPEDVTVLADKVGVKPLFTDLIAMLGNDGLCGTLNPVAKIIVESQRVRTQGLLRPWATRIFSNNPRPVVDRALAQWAANSLWNWTLHTRFKEDEARALQALTGWYEDAFGIAEAGTEAHRVLNLLILRHFSFPSYSSVNEVPKPSPLALALLQGRPTDEVLPLLNEVDLEEVLEDDVALDPPLVLAIGHPHLVRAVLDAGAPVNRVNAFGKTTLMYAAQYNDADSVSMLLAAGASIHAQTARAQECGLAIERGGRTALHYAAENAGLEVIRLLVTAGAKIKAQDDGEPPQTPLDYLARNTRLSDNERAQASVLLNPVKGSGG